MDMPDWGRWVSLELQSLQATHEQLQRQVDEMRGLETEVFELRQLWQMRKDPDGLQGGLTPSQVQLESPSRPSLLERKVATRARSLSYVSADSKESGVVTKCNHHSYIFRSSVWDATYFLGTIHMGKVVSMYNVFLLLLNIAMQFAFCVIIVDNFIHSDFTSKEIEGYDFWRKTIAHDVRYLDVVAQSSLTSRVCGGSAALEMSDTPARAVRAINEYMPSDGEDSPGGFFGEFQGRTMCTLSLVAWCCFILRECRETITGARASWCLVTTPTSQSKTRFARDAYFWKWRSMSRRRVILVTLVGACRLSVGVSLLYCGSLFIVHTVSLSDLLLNAVALGFVLEVDELLFMALAPSQTQALVEEVMPLQVHFSKQKRRCKVDVTSLSCITCMVGFVAYMLFVHLKDQVARLQIARDVICGGNRDFVFAKTHMPFPVAFAKSRPHSSQHIGGIVPDTLEAIIRGNTTEEIANYESSMSGSRYSLFGYEQMSVSFVGKAYNAKCTDNFGLIRSVASTEIIRELVQETLEDTSVTTCADMTPYCKLDSVKGRVARLHCPVTCGCSEPNSTLAVTNAGDGCPETCREQAPYQLALLTGPCQDRSVGDPLLQSYAEGLRIVADNMLGATQVLANFAAQQVDELGCGAIDSNFASGLYLCSTEVLPVKSMNFMCPVTCGCRQGLPDCPMSCGRGPLSGGIP